LKQGNEKSWGLIFAALVAILLLFGSLDKSVAEDGNLKPKEVVQHYCQLQAEGYGISSGGWEKIGPLVAWSDEPGWDTAIVISDYKIGKIEIVGKKAMVTVTYFVLGIDSVEFVKSKRKETIKFELGMIDGSWKITGPQIIPHVKKEFMIKHLRKLQSRARVKERRDQLEAEIQAIIKADK
jgi:hypothetical protein